ncbi:MAG: hypothetical protein COW63_19230 [Bacteroidetes bacterium CG18_big_fil_WC_8_21_14_2_50_41_14]|nr:MAG: hypothetical protein COW63_19230 [Bacteroidetes bacterium CG18_big_fil_WC_8_21_14_2_50_41_14]
MTFYVLTNIVKGNTISFIESKRFQIIYQQFIISRRVGKKSMCVAAKGRLQGRAATLLLLCGSIFLIFFSVFMQQKIHCHWVAVFLLRLACNGRAIE